MARETELDQDDIREVEELYGLSVAGFESIEGGAANSSYLLRTSDSNYVLTVFEERIRVEVIAIGNLLLHLEEHEFPAPRLITPANGVVVTTLRDKPVIVKGHIQGKICENPDEGMLGDVGAALAGLHRVPGLESVPVEHTYNRLLIPGVIGCGIAPRYEAWLTTQRDRFTRALSLDLPRGLIHGDLFCDNVITENEEFRAIIDFEDACRDVLAFDLGMAIVGFCREEPELLSLEKTRAFVRGYQGIRSLEAIEMKFLQSFVVHAAAATSCWRFWKYHIDTPDPKKRNHYREMVRLADEIRDISEDCFRDAVFE